MIRFPYSVGNVPNFRKLGIPAVIGFCKIRKNIFIFEKE